MKKLSGLLPAVATTASMLASSAFAQESTQADTGGLSTGVAVEDQVGQPYVRETFGDWEMRCLRTENGKDPCNLYQLLNDQNDNSVAEVNLFGLPPGQEAVVGGTIITPLETLLTAHVRLMIDDGDGKVYPFSYCSIQGCVSRIGILHEEVEALKKGAVAKMIIVPWVDPSTTVELTMSLIGFTAGLEAVIASNIEVEAQ
jgi:invasion protein IalB